MEFASCFAHPSPVLLQLKKGGVAKAKAEGEKEKECITECKSRRRRDEKAPWALNYGSGCDSGEGGGVEKGRRRGGEKRAMHVTCVRPMATGLPSVFMLMRRAAAFAKMSPTFPLIVVY